MNSWFEGWLELKGDHVFEIVVGSYGVTGKYELSKDTLTLISPDGMLFRMPVVPNGFVKANIPSPPLCQPSESESAPLMGRIAIRIHYGFTRDPQQVSVILRNWEGKTKLARADKYMDAILAAVERTPGKTILWPQSLDDIAKKGDLDPDLLKDAVKLGLVYTRPSQNPSPGDVVLDITLPDGPGVTCSVTEKRLPIPSLEDALHYIYWQIRKDRQIAGNHTWPTSLDVVSTQLPPEYRAAIGKFQIAYLQPRGVSPDDILLKAPLANGYLATCSAGGTLKETIVAKK
ncbi:MAG: hypothetical protein ABI443_03465 [Chthoniobacterales bacterium]